MPVSNKTYTLTGKRIWVAGHKGMVGSALLERLNDEEDVEILTADRKAVDLTRQAEVETWVGDMKPDSVIVAAAKVGGIVANDTYPADFLYENLMIESNIINASFHNNVEKLLFLGSSCIYPKFAPQPIQEDALLTGELEPTNEWYAIAKIAGIKLCQAYRVQHGADFISAMPTNLYGPNDNFDLNSSHVLPALIRKAVEARDTGKDAIEIWGTGSPKREFLHVRDCADALVFLLKNYSDLTHVNVGFGDDISIKDLASLVSGIAGLTGQMKLDTSKPDGTPRKLMSNAVLRELGWSPKIDLETGVREVFKWFEDHREQFN